MQISSNRAVDQLLAAQTAAVQTDQKIDVAIAKKELDAQKQTGEAMIQLLQQAVAISKGGNSTNVDIQA
jgi:hypothetical protein